MYNSYLIRHIGPAVRVFANRPGDLGSIPGRVIPKTQKMVLDASLLNTQHYKVRIKGKVEQSRERSSAPPTPWCSKLSKREPSGHPRLWSPTTLRKMLITSRRLVDRFRDTEDILDQMSLNCPFLLTAEVLDED